MVATTLVAILKHENDQPHHRHPAGGHRPQSGDEEGALAPGGGEDGEELELGVAETYSMLWKIITLPLMPVTIAILLTSKVRLRGAMEKGTKFWEIGLSRSASPRRTA